MSGYETVRPEPTGRYRQLAAALFFAISLTVLTGNPAPADVWLPKDPQRFAVDTEAGQQAVAEKYGIELQPLRLTAMRYMLDFRYRVIDPERAKVLHKVKMKPYVFDAAKTFWSGVMTGRVGTFRQTMQPPLKGVIYTTIMNNPGGHFKRGDRVSVVLGNLVLDGITVE